MKPNDFINKILADMEKAGFTKWEAKYIANELPKRIEENDKRIEDNKPFVVFKKE